MALVSYFVAHDESIGFDRWACQTPRDRFVLGDVSALNRFMRTRSSPSRWADLLAKPPIWLGKLDPRWDACETSARTWRSADVAGILQAAFADLCGPYRGLSVASKMLHLKRPRLIPLLDSLVIEQLGARIPKDATPAVKATGAARVIDHLAAQARANRAALRGLRSELRDSGIDRSAIRLLDILIWAAHPDAGLRAPLEPNPARPHDVELRASNVPAVPIRAPRGPRPPRMPTVSSERGRPGRRGAAMAPV